MPRTASPVRLAALAEFLGCPLEGTTGDEKPIEGFASLVHARENEIAFVRDAGFLAELGHSRARAVVAPPGLDVGGRPVIRSERPGLDFDRLIAEFAPAGRPAAGIAPGAQVDPSARIDATASICAGAIIGAGSEVGARTVVASGVVLGENVRIGSDGWLHLGVLIREESWLGDRVVLQPGVVIGGDGFGLVADEAGQLKSVAQRGRVVLEDDVEIGAHTTIDRATLDATRVRRGAKIDSLVQIAHNCDIGENAVIVAQTGLAGGTIVGAGAVVMAQVGSAGHLRIGDGAFVGARSGLHHDVPDGARVFGSPQMEERSWHRVSAALKRLPELLRRVRRLERVLGAAAGAEASSERDSGED